MRLREENGRTWSHRSQVKGKKSMSLQSDTAQCFPRSGNSGVPIEHTFKHSLKNEIEISLIRDKWRNPRERKREKLGGWECRVAASSELRGSLSMLTLTDPLSLRTLHPRDEIITI